MSETLKQLHQQAQSLSHEERAELAYLLLTSLNHDTPASEDLNATLARRSAEIGSGKEKGRTAEQVHAEIRKRYS
jgi:putative addiction module component (TIGR02574 family)